MSVKKSKKTNENIDPNEVKGIHQFIMGEKLGQGTFGKVRLATHVITGEKVAIKILEKEKIYQQEDKDRVEREIKILKMIRHNNLIQIYQVIQTPTLIYIIMEFSPGKDMFNYIVSNKKIREDEACNYFQQLIEGVDYCHKLKICHRDLKPENLLLEGKTIKLIDFGLSNTWGKTGRLKTACGSPSYAAPEMILGETEYFGSRVDCWSVGVILYVMVCGFLPFEDPNQEKLYKKIIEGKYALPSFVSEPCKDLIRKLMNTDQEKRYTLAEIKCHPWYKSIAPKINEGLLSIQIVLPTDEDIMDDMKSKGFDLEKVREAVILNKYNHLTTSYYLLVQSKIRKGLESESDLFSDRYIRYIKNPDNQLSKYDNDIKLALAERLELAKKREIEKEEKEKNKEPDYSSFSFFQSKNSVSLDIKKPVNPNSKENNELIESLKALSGAVEKSSENVPSSSNPFEVSVDIRNSVREVNKFSNNEVPKSSGKTIIVTSHKKGLFTLNNSPFKYKSKKKGEHLKRPRKKNSTTTFDCSDLNCVKITRDNAINKYEELKERVSKMRENLRCNVKASTTLRRSSAPQTNLLNSNDDNTVKDGKNEESSNNCNNDNNNNKKKTINTNNETSKNNTAKSSNNQINSINSNKPKYNQTNKDIRDELM